MSAAGRIPSCVVAFSWATLSRTAEELAAMGVPGRPGNSAARCLSTRLPSLTPTRPALHRPARMLSNGLPVSRLSPQVVRILSVLRFHAAQPAALPYSSAAASPPPPSANLTPSALVLQGDAAVPAGVTPTEPCQCAEHGPVEVASEAAPTAEEPKKVRVEIVLNETDIKEQFCKGSGKGGQKVNKSKNCVRLHHVPTNIHIRCHETRSLFDNRRIARKLLVLKLDELINGELSKNAVMRRKKREEWLRKREEWLARKAARQMLRLEGQDEDEEDVFEVEESEAILEKTVEVGVVAPEQDSLNRNGHTKEPDDSLSDRKAARINAVFEVLRR